MEKLNQVIYNNRGDKLLTDFRYKENTENLSLLIFCHGFKGFKDWGGFPYMMNKLAGNNFFCVSFNFSYNGVGEAGNDLLNFTRLNLFSQNTFSRELDDLNSVLDYLEENQKNYNYNYDNLILAGHSRGGGIAILKTAEDNRIKKLITLASVAEFDRYSKRMKENWKERGYWEVMNTRTKQMMRLNYTLLEDLEKNNLRLNIKEAVKKINVPYLIIHGKEDLAVDYSEAETLYHLCNKQFCRMDIIPNTGHTFGIVHPFNGTTNEFENVISRISKF